MGKRRDRRQQGSGRRVKLDLWSDDVVAPSGTPGVAMDAHENFEVGGDDGPNHSVGGPSPPSLTACYGVSWAAAFHDPGRMDNTSGSNCHLGVPDENPLSLLGQYSDDEMDDESEPTVAAENKVANEPGRDASNCRDEQVTTFLADLETTGLLTEELSVCKDVSCNAVAGMDQNVDRSCTYEEHVAEDKLNIESGMVDGMLVIEWQAVLHEESGEHYYWNIKTGETTWSKPALWKEESTGIATTDSSPCLATDISVSETDLTVSVLSSAVVDEDSAKKSELDLERIPEGEHDSQLAENVMVLSSPVKDSGILVAEKGLESGEEQPVRSFLSGSDLGDLNSQLEPEPSDLNVQLINTNPGESLQKNEAKEENEDKAKGEVEDEANGEVKNEAKGEVEDVSSGEVEDEAKGEVEDEMKGEVEDEGQVEDEVNGEVKDEAKGDVESDLCCLHKDEKERDSQPEAPPSNLASCEPPIFTTTSSGGTELKIEDGFKVEESSQGILESTDSRTDEESRHMLIQWGGTLLQRLNILVGDSLRRVSACVRLAIEAETRISDSKAFLSQGFLPELYWAHVETQLRHLESVLVVEEAAVAAKIEQQKLLESVAVKTSSSTLVASGERPLNRGCYLEKATDMSLNRAVYLEDSTEEEPCKQGGLMVTFGNGSDLEEGEIQRPDYGNPEKCLDSAVTDLVEGSPNDISEQKLISRDNANQVACNILSDGGGADVDMEVDMEVDEAETEPEVPGLCSNVSHLSYAVPVPMTNPYVLPPSSISAVPHPLPPAESGQLFPVVLASDVWAPPPPPPDDEWAPPPPDDSETIPPPPLEEPPPLPPQSPQPIPSYTVLSLPPVPYAEYHVPEYVSEYMPASEYQAVPESTFYSAYVEELPGSLYLDSTQSTDMTVGLEAYSVASDSTRVFSSWAAPSMPLVPSAPSMPSAPSVPSVPPVLFSESASLTLSIPSASAVQSTTVDSSGTVASVEAKKVAKGKVGKKRTHSVAVAPMLRTNKKVSTLVSKWKQAKEELHGSDEDENDKVLYDIEILERKRQKEIEEWRRQQIASGEALDNANFQPLGTSDWRERVKRAKKIEAREGGTHSESSGGVGEASSDENAKKKKPDLVELSKDLPVGWHAFWDETSGEVYYGNLTTQETSWDRPVV